MNFNKFIIYHFLTRYTWVIPLTFLTKTSPMTQWSRPSTTWMNRGNGESVDKTSISSNAASCVPQKDKLI